MSNWDRWSCSSNPSSKTEVPSPLTTVTEVATGLGMLGHARLDQALAERPAEMVSVAPVTWDQLEALHDGGIYRAEFEAAFANGAAFLAAADGLRGRRPAVIEWKGSQRAPGDEVAPVDLRIDHVYLVSCKYLSKILFNASPAHLFEELLAGRHGRRSGHWFEATAPEEYATLYGLVRAAVDPEGLPRWPGDLRTEDRHRLGKVLRDEWPSGADEAYAALSLAVSAASAARWNSALGGRDEQEAMLWRLLRMGSAPYFVLGATTRRPLRLRIATPWDWRQKFRLAGFDAEAQSGGQPRVAWRAEIRDMHSGERLDVAGHVEIRWSHGRFGGLPEAKVYLDTPHEAVPGYFPLG